jgi:hypothetical protein
VIEEVIWFFVTMVYRQMGRLLKDTRLGLGRENVIEEGKTEDMGN